MSARPLGRWLFLASAWLFVACLIGQVYLAGIGVFAGDFESHRNLGYMLGLLPVLLVIFGLIGRVGRVDIGLSAVLFLQGMLQSVFILVRDDSPDLAALHPVNGVLMLLVGTYLAVDAWRLVRVARVTPTPPSEAPA